MVAPADVERSHNARPRVALPALDGIASGKRPIGAFFSCSPYPQLMSFDVKVIRLAYGVPIGADLEYADEVTLFRALEGRREV